MGAWAEEELAAGGGLDASGLKRVGRVAPRPSASIKASPLSVGFEVLDRQRFDPTRAYAHLAELGVKWARCQTGWCRCETERGRYDFGWLDEVVDSLRAIGIQPWFNLGYGNRLYTPDAPDEFAVGWAPVFDAGAMEAWLRFTKAIAEHFSTRVTHWEIWNEPNITHFWQPEKPDADDYVRLVAQTAPVIREAVPDATVIGIACAGIKMKYIEACLDAGLADLVDAISYHPYRPKPEERYEGEIAQLREAIAARREGVAIWQGENGCPSQGGEESVGALSDYDWNETAQAKWVLRRILTDLRLAIPLTSYFHTVDLVGYRGKTNFKGLLRGADYTRKPAYYAYQCLCALFDADTQRTPLTSELIDQEKASLQEGAFVRNGRALYAYWFPASLLEPWEPKTLAVRLTLPEGVSVAEPVLIDPLSGQAYEFEKAVCDGASVVAEGLPLLDYPLILTDRDTITRRARPLR
ncbi:MAG: beta-galactosidase [Candidatus Hydrogenedentes bacterium]|nr:beta-galactosidase [Candidatus Hydrogenedentota bacterium]